MDGFRIYRANGTVQVDSNSLSFLYADEVYLSTTSTRTITGAAGRSIRVLATGSSKMSGGAAVTTSNSGADLIVTISVSHDGFYRILVTGGKLTNFGIQWESTAGQLTVSSDQSGLVFVGNAVFQNTQQADGYTQLGAGGAGGYQVAAKNPFFNYRISNCPNPPTCFIQMGTPGYFLITGLVQIDATSWQITVAGSNWGSPIGTQYPVIKCFARLSGGGTSGYGIKLFDASGRRTWDSTENMLVAQQLIDWPNFYNVNNAEYTQSAVCSVSTPYILSLAGADYTGSFATTAASGAFYTMTDYISGYQLISGTLYRSAWGIVADKYKDDARAYFNDLPIDRTYIIDGSLYP